MRTASNTNKKKGKIWFRIYLVSAAAALLLTLLGWSSADFCDWYIRNIFPIWPNTYGRFMNLFPFSVGEILLYLGAVVLAVQMVVIIVTMMSVIIRRCSHKVSFGGWYVFARGYSIFFAWTFLIVCEIMTLNCSLLYHASTFSEQYFSNAKTSFSYEELVTVRNLVVERCNELCQEMPRDAEGTILYEGDMKQACIEAMRKLGQTYDRLDGYYPRPKPLATSDFFCQQYMCGYYFPFSMEANYNDVMYIMNKPATMCHELAHLRGYIYEDEANFIAFLACIGSGDPVLEYSGYLSVLNYLDNDFYRAVGSDPVAYLQEVWIDPQVTTDNVFVTAEEWARINGKALIDTETVDHVSDVLADASMKANGVKDGTLSYNRVVTLLLQYYFGDTVES